MSTYATRRKPCSARSASIRTPGALNTQKPAAPGVVQPADRLKSASRIARHDAARALEGGSDHVRGDLVAAGERRRVAVVEVAAALARGSDDTVYVFGSMKTQDGFSWRCGRL